MIQANKVLSLATFASAFVNISVRRQRTKNLVLSIKQLCCVSTGKYFFIMVVLTFTIGVTNIAQNAVSLTIWPQYLQKGSIFQADKKYFKT